MYGAVLFDMDGVVVDTELSVARFWQDLARSEGGGALTREDLDRHVYGRHADHTLRELFPQIPPDRYPDVYRRLRINDEHLRYTPVRGALEVLRGLHAAGMPLALVTGAQHWKAAAVLRQLGLDDVFRVQVRAEDVTAGKPDPGCYLLAAERLGVPISRCLVFEDALSGVTSAVRAGASCVALAPPERERTMLDAGAVAVVRHLGEVELASSPPSLVVGSGRRLLLSAPTPAPPG